jgi:hypothetical protein
MKGKTKYAVFYLGGLVEWAIIFYLLRRFHISSRRLWVAYLLIAAISGVGSLAMYAIEAVSDDARRLKYRAYTILAALFAVGACLCWAVGFFRRSPSLASDVALGATAAMLVGGGWFVYRVVSRRGFGEDGTSNGREFGPR